MIDVDLFRYPLFFYIALLNLSSTARAFQDGTFLGMFMLFSFLWKALAGRNIPRVILGVFLPVFLDSRHLAELES